MLFRRLLTLVKENAAGGLLVLSYLFQSESSITNFKKQIIIFVFANFSLFDSRLSVKHATRFQIDSSRFPALLVIKERLIAGQNKNANGIKVLPSNKKILSNL